MQNRDRSSQPLLPLVTTRSFALSLAAALLVASMLGAVAAAGTTAGAKRDRRPPTVPTGLNVKAKTTSAVTLAWSASTDNVGVAGYGIYRNGTRIATTTATGYTVADLPCGLVALGVDAYDAAHNRSNQTSVSVNVCDDVRPPSAPATPVVSGATNASLSLSWSPSADNVGVAGYDVFAAGVHVGSTGGTSYTVLDLACGSAYTVGIEAYDAAGNRSARSTVDGATTPCPSGSARFTERYLFGSGDDPAAAKSVGFNLIDVGSKWHADALPDGARALLYLGTGAAWDDATCRWDLSDATVASTVSATANDPKVAGYFFSDEPDPARCPNAVAAHRARVALIRSLAPTKFTLMVIDSNSGQATLSQIPQWVGVADYAGLDVYPCYQGRACDFGWQRQVIAAADAVGLSYFGGAQAFRDASEWRWPTAAELQTQLDIWAASKAKGYMLFAWTWAGYDLAGQPALVDVLKRFNGGR